MAEANSEKSEREVYGYLQEAYPTPHNLVVWRGDKSKASPPYYNPRNHKWYNEQARQDYIIFRGVDNEEVKSNGDEKYYNEIFERLEKSNTERVYVEIKDRVFDFKTSYDTFVHPIFKGRMIRPALFFESYPSIDEYKELLMEAVVKNTGIFLSKSKKEGFQTILKKDPNSHIYFACKGTESEWYVCRITSQIIDEAEHNSMDTSMFASPLHPNGKPGETSSQIPYIYWARIIGNKWNITDMFDGVIPKPKYRAFTESTTHLTATDIKKAYNTTVGKEKLEAFMKQKEKQITSEGAKQLFSIMKVGKTKEGLPTYVKVKKNPETGVVEARRAIRIRKNKIGSE